MGKKISESNKIDIPKNLGMGFDPKSGIYSIGDVMVNEKVLDKLETLQTCGHHYAHILSRISLKIAADISQFYEDLFESEEEKSSFYGAVKTFTDIGFSMEEIMNDIPD